MYVGSEEQLRHFHDVVDAVVVVVVVAVVVDAVVVVAVVVVAVVIVATIAEGSHCTLGRLQYFHRCRYFYHLDAESHN